MYFIRVIKMNCLKQKALNHLKQRMIYTFTRQYYNRKVPRFGSWQGDSPNRSQTGIWAGKRHDTGYQKSFSMKHHKRYFKVNTKNVPMYSQRLKRTFYLNVSMHALKTIKFYGGLDNYLLKASYKQIKDSQMALFLRRILMDRDLRKMSPEALELNLKALHLPYTAPRKSKKQRSKQLQKGIPSIQYPIETLRTDLSEFIYPEERFVSRVERLRIEEFKRELEETRDPLRREELRAKLENTDRAERYKQEMLKLEPIRHSDIRNHLVRLKNTWKRRLEFINRLKEKENSIKVILGEDYRHFSEDYPEVQLILQNTELQRLKKENSQWNQFKSIDYNIYDEIYEKDGGFDPFGKKSGFNTKTGESAKTMKLKARKLQEERRQQLRNNKADENLTIDV